MKVGGSGSITNTVVTKGDINDFFLSLDKKQNPAEAGLDTQPGTSN